MRKVMPAALGIAFILMAFCFLINEAYSTARGGAQLPLGSAMRYDPYGSAALYRTLLRMRHPVSLLNHPILYRTDKGVLLVVVPPGGGRAATENYSVSSGYNPPLLKWIRAGNTFLEFSQNQTRIMGHFGVTGQRGIPHFGKITRKAGKAKDDKHKSKRKKQWKIIHEIRMNLGQVKSSRGPWYSILSAGKNPNKLKPWLKRCVWTSSEKTRTPGTVTRGRHQPHNGRHALVMLGPRPFLIGHVAKSNRRRWHILAVENTKPVAIEQKYGLGRIIFVASPWPVYNAGITQADNLNFILAMVGKKPVIFDEWQLGLGKSESVIGALASNGLMPCLLQLILLLLLYTWSRGGYPIQRGNPATERTDTISDQIMSLGHLYARSLSAAEIRQRIHREIIARLSAAIGCRQEELPQRVRGLPSNLAVQVQHLLNNGQNKDNSMVQTSQKNRNVKQRLADTRRLIEMLAQLSSLCEELKRVRYSKS